MTQDTRLALVLLEFLLFIGFCWNLCLLWRAYGDWRFIHHGLINGARQTIAVGTLRRYLVRGFAKMVLFSLFAPRAFFNKSIDPLLGFLAFFLMTVVWTIDTGLDWMDRHQIRWFLKTGRE